MNFAADGCFCFANITYSSASPLFLLRLLHSSQVEDTLVRIEGRVDDLVKGFRWP